jgi:hypothetical protein
MGMPTWSLNLVFQVNFLSTWSQADFQALLQARSLKGRLKMHTLKPKK